MQETSGDQELDVGTSAERKLCILSSSSCMRKKLWSLHDYVLILILDNKCYNGHDSEHSI